MPVKTCSRCKEALSLSAFGRAIGLMRDDSDRLMSAVAYTFMRGVDLTRLVTGDFPSNEAVLKENDR